MASLLGMGILQFLGLQALWLLVMTASSFLRKRRSVEEDFTVKRLEYLK